ncbi:hypothetical protein GCM10011354_22350 [Egicoccus halophilus]|uniref:SLH domain-containing protein n=1 Tax=Egicoccus halophilus TaxID=1670830 RepID=A0A8J3EUF5_9ACTN|nr:hypothetical protein GCM10011354_22350 [Egicoccus halophilus]
MLAQPDVDGASGVGDVPKLGIELPERPSAARLRELRASASTTRHATAQAPDPTDASAANLRGRAHVYNDYCGDSASSRMDLRTAEIRDYGVSVPGLLGFAFTTCRAISRADLTGGVTLFLTTSAGRDFFVDVLEFEGRLVGVVVDLDLGQVVFRGDAHLSSDGHGAEFAFPGARLGSPSAIAFEVVAFDDATVELDWMPEEGERVGLWPVESCQFVDFATRTVVAEPGALPLALAAAEAAGLVPTSVHEASGRFDVVLDVDGTDAALRTLPGVADVEATELLEQAAFDAGADAGTVTAADAGAWWRAQVRAPSPTGAVTGAGVTIGVIDDGVDGSRPEFGGRVDVGRDLVAGRPLAANANSDRGGHGTFVAGVAAASPTARVTGIAPGARIRPYQVFDFAGCASPTAVAAGIDAAVRDGVHVLNLSLGGLGRTPPPIAEALVRAQQAATVVIAAAGNDGLVDRPAYPAEHASTIAVGATDASGVRTPYSNRASWLDLVAPGGNGTTEASGILGLGERGDYGVENGTSFAAPVVSGAAALYLQASNHRVADLRTNLGATASDRGARGRDPEYGFGLLDVEKLLTTTRARPVASVRDITATCRNAAAGRFPDVAPTSTHARGVDCVAHYGIAGGYRDGDYRPGAAVTRGQMATFVVNTIEQSGGTLPTRPLPLTDIAGHAHEASIRKLASAGIVSGYADDSYRPNASVTRAQMATFLVKALEYRTDRTLTVAEAGYFSDVTGAHQSNVDKAAAAGLTGGSNTGQYLPAGQVTRGQMGSFLARTVAYLVDHGHTRPR